MDTCVGKCHLYQAMRAAHRPDTAHQGWLLSCLGCVSYTRSHEDRVLCVWLLLLNIMLRRLMCASVHTDSLFSLLWRLPVPLLALSSPLLARRMAFNLLLFPHPGIFIIRWFESLTTSLCFQCSQLGIYIWKCRVITNRFLLFLLYILLRVLHWFFKFIVKAGYFTCELHFKSIWGTLLSISG